MRMNTAPLLCPPKNSPKAEKNLSLTRKSV